MVLRSFRTVPRGNYTFRTEYLFVTYESQLSVKADGLLTVAVPFPHRTDYLIGPILLHRWSQGSLIHRTTVQALSSRVSGTLKNLPGVVCRMLASR